MATRPRLELAILAVLLWKVCLGYIDPDVCSHSFVVSLAIEIPRFPLGSNLSTCSGVVIRASGNSIHVLTSSGCYWEHVGPRYQYEAGVSTGPVNATEPEDVQRQVRLQDYWRGRTTTGLFNGQPFGGCWVLRDYMWKLGHHGERVINEIALLRCNAPAGWQPEPAVFMGSRYAVLLRLYFLVGFTPVRHADVNIETDATTDAAARQALVTTGQRAEVSALERQSLFAMLTGWDTYMPPASPLAWEQKETSAVVPASSSPSASPSRVPRRWTKSLLSTDRRMLEGMGGGALFNMRCELLGIIELGRAGKLARVVELTDELWAELMWLVQADEAALAIITKLSLI